MTRSERARVRDAELRLRSLIGEAAHAADLLADALAVEKPTMCPKRVQKEKE